MKLLAVRLARSIWLVPPYFLNPRGIFTRPLVEAIKARYSFLKTPLDNPFPKPNEGYKYENGAFKGKNGVVQIVSMTTHDDGVVIDARSSTDDADLFMEDLMAWANKEYGLPSLSELPAKRLHVSELNVAFENAPKIFNQKLAPFLDDVSSAINDKSKGKAEFVGFQLGADQTLSVNPAMFRIEREANTLSGENRYYSFAPTKTDVHLKLLEKLEKVAI